MPIELFDQIAEDYDNWYETDIGRVADQVERDLAVQFFQPSGPMLLEIGCGTGQYTTKLAEQGYNITAVDISEKMMARAREKIVNLGYQVKWLNADITQIIDQLEQYHSILSMSAFEFIPNPEEILARLFEHIEPKGCLVIGVIAGESPWSEFYGRKANTKPESVFAHARFYTESEIRQWKVGGRLKIGKALYFPPEVSSVERALTMEKQKNTNPSFMVAKWVKE
ncbi:class I SAM-dependent methyltransferase [Desulfosporosinus sp. BICA1-9]|uniref:class I SAM-dependent DNA methyltransferase n=1 Tax=Desulfosporosinus sp. BICA1-9 TaxID=1531958 RepID=UPI00054BB6E8|nr:class I SAM-dependent methyltransferase [Desulfosporosinus sp. BICA1-9]KJS49518.1 MAG: methyltransferase [Peptococcaceae bacterium BRH_c23]KJS85224.1 MAG: methyltransferase [Desulfosporosinus sp. BICA1-9]HBW38347.1 class I SAM-dependent methyltransferase [Desulfosporosinus sp.]